MEHTFFLKEPKSDKETLIIFSCYFKFESKQFKYSTGEKIKPQHWNFEENRPKLKGSVKDKNASTIKNQLARYSETFERIEAECKKMYEEFVSQTLKDGFNQEFKKASAKKNLFFDSYDEFMTEKKKRKEWKPSTIKRYDNIKNHLKEFEKAKDYKLTFSKINDRFLTEFADYCYTTLDHNTNTYSRNLGLFKTFMFWALKKRYTYNESFQEFKKPERVVTEEIALTLDQVIAIFEHQAKTESLEKVKDVFVFQCLTGLRFGELALINKHNIKNEVLYLKEDKDVTKDIREIPLFEISNYILKKYDYKLPLITNQKHNDFIKDIFEDAGFNTIVEYTRTKNKERTTVEKAFKDRVSTHTARRTFITIMKKKGIADKTIMSMTGHRDLKTFNTYYKVDNIARKDAIKEAFGSMELPKLKRV